MRSCYYTILYYTIQNYTILYYTILILILILIYTILYYTILASKLIASDGLDFLCHGFGNVREVSPAGTIPQASFALAGEERAEDI